MESVATGKLLGGCGAPGSARLHPWVWETERDFPRLRVGPWLVEQGVEPGLSADVDPCRVKAGSSGRGTGEKLVR